MIFGKYINRYYLKHAPVLLLGLAALLTVDYIQLLIPQLYRLVINGVNLGQVVVNGETLLFTKEVLLQHICLPMIWIVVLMVIGRFLWRICFFGSAVRVAADLRERMFDHSRRLSQQYYQVNKVGNLMSLYTNDLDTIQECFGDGVLMFFDALTLGLLALYKMWTMDVRLTLLALIPALIMFAIGTQMSKVMTRRWEERQEAFSGLSDFAQENFSGIAVIKAFVKEYKELQAFRKLNKENEEINVTYTKIATLLEVLVTLFVESVICIILGYGGYLIYQGRFNAGQLVEYIGYFEAIVWPIMAVSMLTGCATLDARNIASDLEGMLKRVNDKATVSATSDAKELATKAAKAVQADTTEWVAPADDQKKDDKVSMEEAVKAKLETEKITDKYVWYACYKSEDVKNVAQAQEICDLLVSGKAINTDNVLNKGKVANITVDGKKYEPKAGNKFELGLKTFEKKEGDKKVEYTVVIVTCKAVASDKAAS